MTNTYRARVEVALRDAPSSDTLIELGAALTSTGHSALGWVEVHLNIAARDLGAAANDAVRQTKAAMPDVPLIAVEVLTREAADARAGVIPSPATIGVPAAAELLGITEQAVRHKLRTGRLAGRREGRDWRIQRAEIDRASAARAKSKS